jgi:hypothetical protein
MEDDMSMTTPHRDDDPGFAEGNPGVPPLDRSLTGFPFGQFMALPLAEQAADGTWRAVIAISGGRQPQFSEPDKRTFAKVFHSQEEALAYATDQCELKASRGTVTA